MDDGQVFYEMWRQGYFEGKVRYWESDGQGGGWIEYLTPAEAEARDKEKAEEARLEES